MSFKWKIGEFDDSLLTKIRVLNTLVIDQIYKNKFGFILEKNNLVVGFISCKKIPLSNLFISKTGILVQEPEMFLEAIRALRNFTKSNNFSISFPLDYLHFSSSIEMNFLHAGSKETIVHDISLDYGSWFKNLKKKHRYYVNKAIKTENNNCKIVTVEELKIFTINEIYDFYSYEMKTRNAPLLFQQFSDFEKFIHRNKKNIFLLLCFNQSNLGFLSVIHVHNKCANYIMAATNNTGKKFYLSYLGINELFKFMQSSKINFFNFGGINSLTNQGVYHFKKGFGGQVYTSAKYIFLGKRIHSFLWKILINIKC